MNSIRTLSLLFLLLLSPGLRAQFLEKAPLYRISGPIGDSYILGSLHVGINLDDFGAPLQTLIESSEVVIAELTPSAEEIDLWHRDGLEYLKKVGLERPEPDNPMSPKAVQKLIEYGYPKEAADKFSKNSCQALVSLFMFTTFPLDAQILQLAYNMGKGVLALDTPELRRKASQWDNCPVEEWLEWAPVTLLKAQMQNAVQNEIRKYRVGRYRYESRNPNKGLLLRNHAWIPKIESEIKIRNAFIVVGVDHLFGKEGILQLLRDRGYPLRRVQENETFPKESCRKYF